MINVHNCVFRLKCTAKWEDMKETKNKNIRDCLACEKNVYHILEKNDLFTAIELNRCVAIDVVEHSLNFILPGVIRRYDEKPTDSEENIPKFLRKTREDD